MKMIGQKYYQYKDNKLNIIRIVKRHKVGYTILVNGKNRRRIKDDKFFNDFEALRIDGRIFFNIVRMGAQEESKDVIVMLFKEKNIHDGQPQAACRQCIYDAFSSLGTDKMYMGLSLNQENCPENIPFSSMIQCNGVLYTEQIAVYNNDSLEDILYLLEDEKQFDSVLFDMFLANAKTDNKVEGFSNSLKSLLKDNYFMNDYYKVFGIEKVDFEITYDKESLELTSNLDKLQYIVSEQMFRTYVIPYNKEIDLKKIERSNVFICDSRNKFYIIAYDKGEYINDYLKKNISDKRNIVKMIKQSIKKGK